MSTTAYKQIDLAYNDNIDIKPPIVAARIKQVYEKTLIGRALMQTEQSRPMQLHTSKSRMLLVMYLGYRSRVDSQVLTSTTERNPRQSDPMVLTLMSP